MAGAAAGRGAPLKTVDGGADGSEADDAGAGTGMLLRPEVGAPDGAEVGRGANGAAGPPIGRAAIGGAERAPTLPELAKGAALDEGGDVLAAPEPPAPGALIGGRMKGGEEARAPAPPVVAGAAAVTGMAGAEGTVAETTGPAADVRALPSAGVANGANAPAGVGDTSVSGRGRGAGDAGLVGGGDADDAAGVTRASALAACGLTALADAGTANSSRPPPAPAIVITPPQTEQRARATAMGTLAGSTRKTERHSGQVTFMPSPPWGVTDRTPRCATRLRADCRSDDPPSRPIPAVSSHSSSFPSPTRLPVPHA